MRLKRDPDLFQSLLRQPASDANYFRRFMSIVLGNPEVEHTIIMVANPYCVPCAETHKELDRLLSHTTCVKATIIFTCDGADRPETQLALHVAALAKEGKAAVALTNWYEQPKKNYGVWANRFPADTNGLDVMTIAEQHSEWCRIAEIIETPTVYVDGYKLPRLYNLDNLRWLISELKSERTVSNVCL